MLMSNSELKEECRSWNLSASGNKTALVQGLLTLIKPIVAVPTDPSHVVTISEWTTYSNAKAMLSNAVKGGIYPEFTPFSPQEIKSFLGL
jgi:hypothetical protein